MNKIQKVISLEFNIIYYCYKCMTLYICHYLQSSVTFEDTVKLCTLPDMAKPLNATPIVRAAVAVTAVLE